ncbi:hypothetical protein OF117_11420 [Geodermatophilus sp. YIM 151500]|uniref:hypothetical protein n=1 Tax=Geodermatophilus sp. YIM 151500 TaxID=2984531 RepID=UPI0021E4C8B0|nr:hypothetical protein [Geodermatophilus sp. YIM 151500]MCV2489970.1 hypothetical protein [Geodermatophilus sp. YIM 151500]
MADRTRPTVTLATRIGPDETSRPRTSGLPDGSRLTEDGAAEIVDEVRRRVATSGKRRA